VTPDGWKRFFFRPSLNAVVAHGPQHFSVRGINQAFVKLFFDLVLKSDGEFWLLTQVHDSIESQVVSDKVEEYKKRKLEIMDIPQPVGKRVLRIPLDTTVGKYWKEEK
jgi:DNA polymerase I-like protein with 3'-5' exonuclease and polymerase domains